MGLVVGIDGDIYKSLSVIETPAQIKSGATIVYGGLVHNENAGVRYLKFYNALAANVSVGTTVPVMTIAMRPDTITYIPGGWRVDTGLTVVSLTGLADADTTGATANETQLTLIYK